MQILAGITTQTTKLKVSRELLPTCQTFGEKNHSTKKCNFGVNAANRPPPPIRRPTKQSQNPRHDKTNNANENAQTGAQDLK